MIEKGKIRISCPIETQEILIELLAGDPNQCPFDDDGFAMCQDRQESEDCKACVRRNIRWILRKDNKWIKV